MIKKERVAVNIFWFRRDLRLEDNTALYHALRTRENVLPIFILDPEIIERYEFRPSEKMNFIYETLFKIKKKLEKIGSSLLMIYGSPIDVLKNLLTQYHICSVYSNRDYDPYSTDLDLCVEKFLKINKIEYFSYKDHVIFEKDELIKEDGKPYSVFTAYKNKFIEKYNNEMVQPHKTISYFHNFIRIKPFYMPTYEDLGIKRLNLKFPSKKLSRRFLEEYSFQKDIPSRNGTSKLSVHLRYGTISIRKVTALAAQHSSSFFNELIWRNFYSQILWFYPYVATRAFKPIYDDIKWENELDHFEAWCKGKTGYPFVDAGMRELNETGFMHNRLRMITASFLCKHLLIDWRWGEAYFAEKLLDYDLASNNGGWQWCAGTGCDSAPYFRIFNPEIQAKKFDPDFEYIRKWIPEFDTPDYPKPIVDLKLTRERALDRYNRGIKAE